jgi:phosphate transport system substrate-binding protein
MSANNASGTNSSGASEADKSHLPKKMGRTPIYALVAVVIIVVAIVGYGAAVGWFSPKKAAANCVAETLQGAGSTLVNPVMSLWVQTYAQSTCVQVNYNPVGSGGGVSELTGKLVDFGASDAPLSATQISQLPGGSTVLTIPEVVAGVAIIYNVNGVAKGLNLSGTVLAGIYLGQITNWNNGAIASINPGVTLPNQNITVVERGDSSGTTFVYTSFLSQDNSTWKSKVGAATTVNWPTGIKGSGSLVVAADVKSTPGAIGYVDLAYAITNLLNYAKVGTLGGQYVLPTEASTAAAAAAVTSLPAAGAMASWSNVSLLNEPGAATYPIATFSYLMVYSDLGAVYGSSMTQAHAQAIVTFLWWVVHTGQTYSVGLSYVPLSSNVVTSDETAINSVLFNGQTLSSH